MGELLAIEYHAVHVVVFFLPFPGLFGTSRGQVRRHTKGEGREEDTGPGDQPVEHIRRQLARPQPAVPRREYWSRDMYAQYLISCCGLFKSRDTCLCRYISP